MKSLNSLRTINGQKIHSHGGHILFFEGYYYLYGEDRRSNYYVSCYRSKDLKEWEFVSYPLTTKTKQEKNNFNGVLGLLNDEGKKINVERPKVIYNEQSKTFVMYAHYENGKDYSEAAVCLATAKKPGGPFTYHGFKRPFGHMSRDLTVYQDDDGKAYLVSASNNNADLHFYLLTEDYLDFSSLINKQFIGLYREAPAIFKENGVYYLLSSFCTGWAPNQCKYSFATSLDGKWARLKNIGNKTTSHSQPAFILTVNDKHYYIGDRWGGLRWKGDEQFNYEKSYYVYSEIKIDGNNLKFID